MKISVVDKSNKKKEDLEIKEGVLPELANEKVIAQYVYSYLSNQRQSTASTKDRSEVRGGGKKPWRQKGTGRARFGSSRVPIWRGGGVTFGPTPQRNWKKKLNKSFKKSALKNVMKKLLEDEKVTVIDKIELKGSKTKTAESFVNKFNKDRSKMLIVTNEYNENLIMGMNNIKNINTTFAGEINAYVLLNAGSLLIEKEAVKNILKIDK